MNENKALPIITPYGPQVPDIYALRPCDIDTRKILDWMEKTKRFNGHSPVSLLDHTVLVMRYTAELGLWFIREDRRHPWLKTAAAHDMAEYWLTDLPTPLKTPEYKKAEADILEQLMIHYGISDGQLQPELPDIVKKADVLALRREITEHLPSKLWGYYGMKEAQRAPQTDMNFDKETIFNLLEGGRK